MKSRTMAVGALLLPCFGISVGGCTDAGTKPGDDTVTGTTPTEVSSKCWRPFDAPDPANDWVWETPTPLTQDFSSTLTA